MPMGLVHSVVRLRRHANCAVCFFSVAARGMRHLELCACVSLHCSAPCLDRARATLLERESDINGTRAYRYNWGDAYTCRGEVARERERKRERGNGEPLCECTWI
eukprot:5500966-Pyramimonas_sp.AAC.1